MGQAFDRDGNVLGEAVGATKLSAQDTIGADAEFLRKVFTYHAPHGDQPERYQRLRESARLFAEEVVRCVPPCADRTAAIRKIREAVMTANAGIAIQEEAAEG